MKLWSISASGSKVPQKTSKLANEKEAEEKAPVKKSIQNTPAKKVPNQTRME